MLRDITFSVVRGEMVAILGPSGCGKTTLLRVIAGLVPYNSGRTMINGCEVEAGKSANIGMVFQEPRLLPWRNVYDNVKLPFELRGLSADTSSAIESSLALVGLAEFASAYPHELSGGMRSRVALARAMAQDPELLLLDEPLTGLDVRTREDLQEEIIRIWKTQPMSMIWVTHAPEEAVYLADRIIVLSRRPAAITGVLAVGVSRPRHRRDPELQRIVAEIRSLFQ